MAILALLYHLSVCLSPPLGIFINSMLIWLVLKKTPKEMRVHSRILLQTCFLDIFVLAVMTIEQPLIVNHNDFNVFFMDGIFIGPFAAAFGLYGLRVHASLLFVVYYLDVFSICAQFIYRYLVLNRGVRITLFRYMLMLAATFLLVLILGTTVTLPQELAKANMPQRELESEFIAEFIQQSEQKVNYLTFEMESANHSSKSRYILMLAEALAYAVIIYCGTNMVRYVNGHNGLAVRMRKLNRQLTRTLIILAILPLLLLCFDLLFVVYALWLTNEWLAMNQWILALQLILNMPSYWLPVLNPLISIFTNTPYRRTMLRIFRCANGNGNQVVPFTTS